MRRLTAATFAALICLSALVSGQVRSTSRPAPRTPGQSNGRGPGLSIDEITIAQAHAAMRAGRLTCQSLVQQYLRANRGLRQAGAGHQRDRRRSTRTRWRRPTSSTAASRRRARRAAALRPRDRQGQLRDDRPAERGRLARARRVRLGPRRVPGRDRSRRPAPSSSPSRTWRSSRSRRTRRSARFCRATRGIPYALDRVTAGSSGGTAAAVAANFGADRPRQRHRQLDPRPVVAPGARRDPLDDGADEPERASCR